MSISKKLMWLAAGMVLSLSAWAKYPDRPIVLVVPFEAAGSTDIIGRIVADHLATALKNPVVVENRSGSGGTVGTAYVSHAAPDGYTLLLATAGTHSINPNLRKVPYDPVADFEPVSLAVKTPVLAAVNPSLGVKSLTELAAFGKSKPGALNFASAGSGSTSHLTGELFNQLTGAGMVHIPYRGAGPALNDVLSGRVPVMMNNLPSLLPQVQAGKLQPLAVASTRRSPLLPDVPSAVEAGVPGFEVDGWFGIVVPAGTPSEAVARLHEAMQTIDTSEKVKQQLNAAGSEPATSPSPEAFAEYMAHELARWKEIVDKAGARLD